MNFFTEGFLLGLGMAFGTVVALTVIAGIVVMVGMLLVNFGLLPI